MNDVSGAPQEPGEDWRHAVGTLREAAKWIIAAFAGVGAAVLGVLPVAGIAKIDSGWSIALAVAGALLALAGVALGIWATSNVLAPRVSTLRTAADLPSVVAAINQDPVTFLGGAGMTLDGFLGDLSGWQRTMQELSEARGPDEVAEQQRSEAFGIARANVESRASIAQRIVSFGHFEYLSAVFRTARTATFCGFAAIALGVGLFLAATVLSGTGDKTGAETVAAGRPALVRLQFSDAGRAELRDRLSEACLRQPVSAYLFEGDWVVVTTGGDCRPVGFRWTPALGTVTLPRP
jgi:hypothetical protein